jgi:chromate transporter
MSRMSLKPASMESLAGSPPRLLTVLGEWGRIGCIAFGGPPTHIALLRDLCVTRRSWMTGSEFEDAVAACNLLPGPASTQLAIFCAWLVRGPLGAVVGTAGFIVPGLVVIVGLAALFLGSPPLWIKGAGAGAGAAVAAVAVQAGASLLRASRGRASSTFRSGWAVYLTLGGVAAALAGPWLVLVLVGCGTVELVRRQNPNTPRTMQSVLPVPLLASIGTGGTLSLVWVAVKVGALSFGGGFVIVPLLQGDAVGHYHWLTAAGFLNAVALGQITPGPVVQTIAVIGYAAAGIGGAVLASFVAFCPSLVFVLVGGPRFDGLRTNPNAQAFLNGAGPAAIGAILGSAIPLARALAEPWQYGVSAAAAALLLLLRRGIVATLLLAGGIGVLVALSGGPLPR